jgi:cytochrome bd-type quinol oxidase subunit 2
MRVPTNARRNSVVSSFLSFAIQSALSRPRQPRRIWNFAFAGGSLVAAFAQGLVLDGFIGGVDVQNGIFHGSPFSFLTSLEFFAESD